MNLSGHFSKLRTAPTQRRGQILRILGGEKREWSYTIFPTPALPTLRQIHSEIPFSAHLCREKNCPK
jgi:hypothetical protein